MSENKNNRRMRIICQTPYSTMLEVTEDGRTPTYYRISRVAEASTLTLRWEKDYPSTTEVYETVVGDASQGEPVGCTCEWAKKGGPGKKACRHLAGSKALVLNGRV